MDITSGPMASGVVSLVAVVDWFSRKVLAWRLSIPLETEPCVEALSKALARPGRPEIMRTDQEGARSPPSPFSRPCRTPRLRSAWTARARGATMSLSNGSGGRSQTRKSPCAPTVASRRRVAGWTAIGHSTTGAARIPHLAGKRPIRPMSTSQRQARRRHNQRGDPLIDSSQTVQNSPATSGIKGEDSKKHKFPVNPLFFSSALLVG